jgi:Ca2+/Na+ antiporter
LICEFTRLGDADPVRMGYLLFMTKNLVILVLSAAAIVGAVRYLLVPGIGRIGAALKFSAKVRGQMIGYATSVPELTVLVAGALAGVFTAGLWNIAASNIINWALFLATVFAFRQQLDLKNTVFVDEIVFGILSVVIPLLMFAVHIGTGYSTVAGLLGFFVLYKILDKRLNKAGKPAPVPPGSENGTLGGGSALLVIGILVILLSGRFLGHSAGELIKQLNVPAWAVGWILGLVTSVCELASFIEIYRVHKPKDSPEHIKDTQEALDALVASNVSNLGLILPIGMLVYLIVSRAT